MKLRNFKIRYSKENEKEIAKKFWEESFDDNEEQRNFYFENIFNYKNYLVLEEHGKIKSSLHENPYILNFDKSNYKTKYIVGVSTDKKERKKGYMKKLIITMLKNLKKENYPFIFLNPINPILYRQYGFEYFSLLEKYTFNIDLLKELEKTNTDNSQILEITEINYEKFLDDLIEIYDFSMQDKLSYLIRDKYYFKKLLLEVFTDKMKVFILYKDNTPMSYMIFGFDKDKIEIRESFSKNIESKKQILFLLYKYKENYKKIEVVAEENSNLEFLFENQLEIEKRIEPFMMLRIISPLILLEKYKDTFKNLKIYIKDDIIEENNAVYIFNDKKIILSDKFRDYDFKINIGNLSQLLSGFLSFEDLVKSEKIEFKNNKNLEKFRKLKEYFRVKSSYLYEMI
ncbi:MAG: GNAT family N-acetyltransferase [Fusobacterium sp.]|nr:GNAT family N-acetyltransferase [Fusobacterium sp.]